MWSWDTEARMKKKQSNDPKERKQKKNKEHFIHIGPKLKAAREPFI